MTTRSDSPGFASGLVSCVFPVWALPFLLFVGAEGVISFVWVLGFLSSFVSILGAFAISVYASNGYE